MNKQVAKIAYDGSEVFFFDHDFKTGYEHAEEFIERNKGKLEMKLYWINNLPFGDKWKFVRIAYIK